MNAAALIFSCFCRRGGGAVTTRDGVRMGKCLKLCVLVMGCGLAFGCATKQSSMDETMRVERFRRSYEAALDKEQGQAGSQVLTKARRPSAPLMCAAAPVPADLTVRVLSVGHTKAWA